MKVLKKRFADIACKGCKKKNKKHYAGGRCHACYMVKYRKEKKNVGISPGQA